MSTKGKEAHNLNDLTGKRFSKLVVIKRVYPNTKCGFARWLCRCDCGNYTTVASVKLKNGNIVSCGCYRKRLNGDSKTRLYNVWSAMQNRCNDASHDHYDRYGGRGITICTEWSDYLSFKEWALSTGYADDLSIDRIDPNGNYEPSNCKWSTQKEQCNNRNNNHIIEYNGEKYTISQFADFLGYKYYTVMNRVKLGWTPEEIAMYGEGHGKRKTA